VTVANDDDVKVPASPYLGGQKNENFNSFIPKNAIVLQMKTEKS